MLQVLQDRNILRCSYLPRAFSLMKNGNEHCAREIVSRAGRTEGLRPTPLRIRLCHRTDSSLPLAPSRRCPAPRRRGSVGRGRRLRPGFPGTPAVRAWSRPAVDSRPMPAITITSANWALLMMEFISKISAIRSHTYVTYANVCLLMIYL